MNTQRVTKPAEKKRSEYSAEGAHEWQVSCRVDEIEQGQPGDSADHEPQCDEAPLLPTPDGHHRDGERDGQHRQHREVEPPGQAERLSALTEAEDDGQEVEHDEARDAEEPEIRKLLPPESGTGESGRT